MKPTAKDGGKTRRSFSTLSASAVKNERETRSVSSSRKRINRTRIDRLSTLPDCLLIRILSFLGLEEGAITSVLSKRWRFLWTYLPRLEFWEVSHQIERTREFVTRIHRILSIRSGCYVEKFGVNFMYDESFASDVDAWVEFSVKNKAKEICLMLHFNEEGDLYSLPQILYLDSSLTNLSLRGCILTPETTIRWRSLASLDIRKVEVPQYVIEKILSGCPVLYKLELDECWGFNRLDANCQSLRVLEVRDSEGEGLDPLLEISAPYIHYLDISLNPGGRKLLVRNIPALVKVDIDFVGYGWNTNSVDVMSNTRKLLEDTKHVKALEVGVECFEVLSMIATNGWQLPQSRRAHLTLNTSGDREHNIAGFISLLESSPDLETLVIEGHGTDMFTVTLDPSAKRDLDCDLLHLKTINITNIADENGEPLLTLARILLKRATVLEKMVIVAGMHTWDFDEISPTLLAYPRSSQKALVLFPE